MGKLVYNAEGASVTVDDRSLAHLQIVIGVKLRREEAFFFTWLNDVSLGSGRNSIWISPSRPLTFRFSGNRPATIDEAWIDTLTRAANSPAGLHVTSENQPRHP